jgi:predicted TIM-barrel fold metal-dependent hydrolase
MKQETLSSPSLPDYSIIDAHAHIMPWDLMLPNVLDRFGIGHSDFDETLALTSDPVRLVDYMDERRIERMALINYVSKDVFGLMEDVNEFAARYASHNPARFIPFGGIDPPTVKDVATEMDHLLGDLRLKGIKIHPPHQLFRSNAYLDQPELAGLATVYEKCIEYDVPVMVHTGTSIFPGARNKYGNPLDLDDVVVDFPELKLIIAHGGRPLWMDEALFVLRRSPNSILDISGVPPKKLLEYFPWLERVADRAIFGTDWPGPMVLDVAQNVQDFYALPLSEEIKRKVLRDNAQRLFPL